MSNPRELPNIPAEDKTVKRAIVPKRGAFSYFDYKAVEPRLAAYFMDRIGHPEFAEQLRAGQDPYTVVARLVTGKTEITEEERSVWKRMFLSLMYGGGAYTIQMQFDCSKDEARKMIRTFHDGWPAVRELSNRVQATAKRRGYIIALDGRHLHPEAEGFNKLGNKLVQGSAAGLMKSALLNIYRHLEAREPKLESRMVSVIHDECIFDGPISEVEILHEEIPSLMRKGYEHVHEVVPILVDHEVSTTSWASKLGYDEWKESLGEGGVGCCAAGSRDESHDH